MQNKGGGGWDTGDYIFAFLLITGIVLLYKLAVRKPANIEYRAAVVIMLVTVFVIIWVNLAVGIIGSEGNAANLMLFAVTAIAIIGSVIVRFCTLLMLRVSIVTAAAHTLVTLIALFGDMGYPESGPVEIVVPNLVFIGMWGLSAWLFYKSAKKQEAV